MNLAVNLTSPSIEWEVILKSIGVPFSYNSIKHEEFHCLIVTSPDQESEPIRSFLNNGGTAMAEADVAVKVLNISAKRAYISYLKSSEKDRVYSINEPGDYFKGSFIADGANCMLNQRGKNTILAEDWGSGKIIILPSGFASSVFNSEIKRKIFSSSYGDKPLTERVSKVNKNILLKIIQQSLEYLYNEKGFPFVSLWHLPFDWENVFGFRIDTDFGSKDELLQLYALCKNYDIPAAWFVETKSADNHIAVYKSFREQEIGFHCNRHRIFSSTEKNKREISEGLKLLSNIGIEPEGYAAPYGEWNESIAEALKDFTFIYSSEFGYIYNSIPIFPILNSKVVDQVQVPIHPVSMGRLHWAGLNEDEMVLYYKNLIQEKLMVKEPVFLYTHPGEKRFNVLEKIFDYINNLSLRKMKFIDYANWWRTRDSYNLQIEFDSNLKIKSDVNEPLQLKVVYPDKKIYLAPLSDPNNKENEIKISSTKNEVHIKVSAKQRLKMFKHDILHKYRKYKQ